MEKIKGMITDIVFQNEDNGYTVAQMRTSDDEITIVGCLPTLKIGETIEAGGTWKSHETYGMQFQAESFMPAVPSSVDGILAYLSSGAVKGIGAKMAKRIVDCFGVETMMVLQQSPEKLTKVEGIGKKKAAEIAKAFSEDRCMRNLMMELLPYGIGTQHCLKIYKRYGDSAMERVRQNPYALSGEISGIGFKTADKIGISMGIDMRSSSRIRQGIIHTLRESASSGHTYLPRTEAAAKAASLLEIEKEGVDEQIYEMALDELIHVENAQSGERVYMYPYYIAENGSCSMLIDLASAQLELPEEDLKERLDSVESEAGISLASRQKEAVLKVFERGVTVITGGPGTGKTTTINSLIKLLEGLELKVKLAAPTGRAAKRMSETTGKEAATIHRLLEMAYSEDEEVMLFLKGEDDQLECDALIVDEASMIDIMLMYNLLKAVKKGTRLVLVGDVDQLPPVGAGNVLSDIIESGAVGVVRLDEIFRQARESMIVVNAHMINKGDMPLLNQKDKDFFFIGRQGPIATAEEVVSLVAKRLPEYYNLDPVRDIQVISAMRKGEAGVTRLNELLQSSLNPASAHKVEEKLGRRIFRVGDKVMQTRNNYEKKWESEDGTQKGQGVFNGDIGYVFHVDKADKALFIVFDDIKVARYDFSELDEIDHSFCTTVHKSQGSEFEAVVMPLSWAPPMLLTRNLLYTGITRAKRLVVLVGERRFLEAMVKNVRNESRYCALGEKLMRFIEEGILGED